MCVQHDSWVGGKRQCIWARSDDFILNAVRSLPKTLSQNESSQRGRKLEILKGSPEKKANEGE
jgi:hypothetical protein